MYPPEQIMTANVSAPDTFYIFRWDRHGRKGERCLVRYVTGRVTPRSQ
jgi:hypothetical protein